MGDIGLSEILRPLEIVAQFLRISPYRFDQSRTIHLSKSALIQSIICMGGILTYTIATLDNQLSPFNEDFAKAGTIKILLGVKVIGNAINMLLTFLITVRNAKFFLEVAQECRSIDQEFFDLGQKNEVDKINKKMKRWVLIMLISIEGFLDFAMELVFHFSFYPSYNIIDSLVAIYPILILDYTEIVFYTLVKMSEERFRILNDLVSKMAADSHAESCPNYPPNSDEFCRNLKKYISIHKKLVAGCRATNEVFSLQFLLVIAMSFVLLIGDLHTATYIVLFQLFSKQYRVFIALVKSCILCLCGVKYAANKCMDLCRQANATKNLILGIKIGIEMEEARDTVIASTLKLMQNKLEITACKLFTIDNALVFSICAAASSYLFIMLQLDLGSGDSNSSVLNGSPTHQ